MKPFFAVLFVFCCIYPSTAKAGNDPSNRMVYALIIGINQYKNSQIPDLNYEAADAEKMYAFICEGKLGRVSKSSIVLLTNENAGKKNVIQCLDTLFKKAGKDDLLLFFFAGHGEKGYFLPYDFLNDVPGSYLKYETIQAAFRASHASNKLLLANACYSGSMRKYAEPPASMPGAQSGETPGNAVVFLSCRAEEVSWETSDLKQSVFVYFLITGLRGAADSDGDGAVSLGNLFYFVRNSVYDYVKNKLNREQCPVMYGQFDKNMPLTTTR